MIQLCVLGSGSSGNCAYISDGQSALLLDAGFSAKEIFRRMKETGLDPACVRGIVISHEHGDHVRGAGPVSRALDIPVYINKPTYSRIKNAIGKIKDLIHFETGSTFMVNGINASSFSISHDCADPCAFVFENDGGRLGFVTDSGAVTMLIEEKLRGVDYLVIESNHDPEILKAGPYPWKLKQRIASRSGHLSNEVSVELVGNILHSDLQGVTFAHLSKTNNNPDLVGLMARSVLERGGTPFCVASQDTPGGVITIE